MKDRKIIAQGPQVGLEKDQGPEIGKHHIRALDNMINKMDPLIGNDIESIEIEMKLKFRVRQRS